MSPNTFTSAGKLPGHGQWQEIPNGPPGSWEFRLGFPIR
jgi:hypothetical protein